MADKRVLQEGGNRLEINIHPFRYFSIYWRDILLALSVSDLLLIIPLLASD